MYLLCMMYQIIAHGIEGRFCAFAHRSIENRNLCTFNPLSRTLYSSEMFFLVTSIQSYTGLRSFTHTVYHCDFRYPLPLTPKEEASTEEKG